MGKNNELRVHFTQTKNYKIVRQRIWFIINPISGVRRKDDIPALIYKYLDKEKFEYAIQYTKYKGHAVALTQLAIQEKVDIVCAVGGDGSVHEVGTTLIGAQPKLAIIPIGSGNGLARHMNIPLTVKKAIDCINDNYSIVMDTVLVNDKPVLGFTGFGLDAIVAKKFDEDRKRGFWTYVKHLFREFFKYNPINISIDTNGQIKKTPAVLCTVANTSEFGNGFKVSPKSDATDGKLELFILKPFSWWRVPELAFQFFNGTSDQSRYTEVISFEKARINLSKNIGQYDGEPVKVGQELNVQVVPHSLHIVIGKK